MQNKAAEAFDQGRGDFYLAITSDGKARELPPVSLDIALSERRSRWTSRGTPK